MCKLGCAWKIMVETWTLQKPIFSISFFMFRTHLKITCDLSSHISYFRCSEIIIFIFEVLFSSPRWSHKGVCNFHRIFSFPLPCGGGNISLSIFASGKSNWSALDSMTIPNWAEFSFDVCERLLVWKFSIPPFREEKFSEVKN